MKKLLARSKAFAVGAGTTLAVASGSAMAELPAEVTTEIASVKADITSAGALIIGLAVVAMGIRWVKATFF